MDANTIHLSVILYFYTVNTAFKIVNPADHLFLLELIINPNKTLLSPRICLCVSRPIFRVSHYCNQKENPSPVSSAHLVERQPVSF